MHQKNNVQYTKGTSTICKINSSPGQANLLLLVDNDLINAVGGIHKVRILNSSKDQQN